MRWTCYYCAHSNDGDVCAKAGCGKRKKVADYEGQIGGPSLELDVARAVSTDPYRVKQAARVALTQDTAQRINWLATAAVCFGGAIVLMGLVYLAYELFHDTKVPTDDDIVRVLTGESSTVPLSSIMVNVLPPRPAGDTSDLTSIIAELGCEQQLKAQEGCKPVPCNFRPSFKSCGSKVCETSVHDLCPGKCPKLDASCAKLAKRK